MNEHSENNGESFRPTIRTNAFQRFFKHLSHGGYPLFIAALAAVLWANQFPDAYHAFWHTKLSISAGPFSLSKSLSHWVNDGLMAVFFFLVGLEIKREFLVGGLSTPKQAGLPIAAALGGMVIPAIFYAFFNFGESTLNGWGIPMATDIAFSMAILGLLGTRIPYGLKIFLSAFAIADDLGAVLVIAVFYTPQIHWQWIYIGLFFLGGLFLANRLWVRWIPLYLVLGLGLWYSILGSGIHATVAGVMTAFFVPAKGKNDTDTFVQNIRYHLKWFEEGEGTHGHSILLNRKHLDAVQAMDISCRAVETPLQRMEHGIQGWIALGVLPLFALANAGLVLKGIGASAFFNPISIGIIIGLAVGKPLGVFLFTRLGSILLRAPLSGGVRWLHILGVGFLGGIGFTMSLFISGLSFSEPQNVEFAKLGIITGSIISGIIGFSILYSGRLSKEKMHF